MSSLTATILLVLFASAFAISNENNNCKEVYDVKLVEQTRIVCPKIEGGRDCRRETSERCTPRLATRCRDSSYLTYLKATGQESRCEPKKLVCSKELVVRPAGTPRTSNTKSCRWEPEDARCKRTCSVYIDMRCQDVQVVSCTVSGENVTRNCIDKKVLVPKQIVNTVCY